MTSASVGLSVSISALLRARNPLIWLVTAEEARAERIVIEATASAGYAVTRWDCSRGTTGVDGKPIDRQTSDVATGLAAIRDSTERKVWILRDLPTWLRDPNVLREVRNLCAELPSAPREQARAMIITSSIERCIDYYHAVNRCLANRRSPYKAIIAFSGENFPLKVGFIIYNKKYELTYKTSYKHKNRKFSS